MAMNLPGINYGKQPMFVKEMDGAGSANGVNQSFANINDIANLQQVSPGHWEADSRSGLKNPNGTTKVYHFDDLGARQILNYMA